MRLVRGKPGNQEAKGTYIFNNAEELRQQEQKLQNIRPKKSWTKMRSKLHALNSRQEQDRLVDIQINKVNSDRIL